MSRPILRNIVRSVPTIAPVPHRSVLSLAGPQAPEFLNGIITSSVLENSSGSPEQSYRPMFSTFLHAQGRILYDVFIYTHTMLDGKPAYLIEYDSRASTDAAAPPLLSMMKRYVLRSRVKLRDVSEEYDVWAAWGSEPESKLEREVSQRKWSWARSGAVEPDWSERREWPWGMEEERVKDRRAVGMGARMLVQKGERPKESSTHDLAPSDTYTLHRILHGVPEGIHDIPPLQAFPMDSNVDVMGGLDFRKGCYVGQELTVRTYHTGVIRKRILPVLIHPQDECPAEISPSPIKPSFPPTVDIRASIIHSQADDRPTLRPRGTGKLLSSTQGVGLALLRLEHVEGAARGELGLGFEFEEGEEGMKVVKKWGITSWWPDWWPTRPEV